MVTETEFKTIEQEMNMAWEALTKDRKMNGTQDCFVPVSYTFWNAVNESLKDRLKRNKDATPAIPAHMIDHV